LNQGGWHDAGDFDLRIESQADEVSILAAAYEAFHLDYDDTTVDESTHLTQIHVPDGRPDVLEQVEHGILTVLGSYRSMGRLYRGIQEATLPQYTMLGDQVNVTDGLRYNPTLKPDQRTGTESGKADDRLVFTEESPDHEYRGIAALAAGGRVLKESRPELARECVTAALALWNAETDPSVAFPERIRAEVQLWQTTHDERFRKDILARRTEIIAQVAKTGFIVAPIIRDLADPSFTQQLHNAIATDFKAMAAKQRSDSPFGIPYKPYIWGAGWDIERFGVEQYYLHRAFPDVVSTEYMLNALNFMLGVHPGLNTASFASGVGARSTTIAYGFNRADSSYIPGGVVSGTALIRPDFPELKDFGYLWQQMEYVLGGGSSNYMFLVLAADQVLNENGVVKSQQ
ncbi:MAG: glycoside hydrolase family 9 protein, partial [Janthinobacterium lividum]